MKRERFYLSYIIIPQKLLQYDWSFTNQHFRCLVLSPFESCHVIDIMLPLKPNICHVRDIMLLCKPNVYHVSFRKVILRRVVCSLILEINKHEINKSICFLLRTTGICTSKKHGTSKHTQMLIAL